MKKLQESLLDDEDTLMNDTKNAAKNLKALKILDKLSQDIPSRKEGEDYFGRKLNRGDIVMAGAGAEIGVDFYMVKNVDIEDDECLLVWNKDGFNDKQPRNYEVMSCEYLIKIDLKILEQIIKL